MPKKIMVQGIEVQYQRFNESDYISLTDLARFKTQEPSLVIGHWMRTRNTIDYLTAWESLYNINFKPTEIGRLREECSTNTFMLSPQKWVELTDAVGVFSRAGKGGGTYAHKDIAFKFASWISVEFELYVIKEFQRLKEEEQKQLVWSARRELTKINYRIHTDAIKEHLIVPELTQQQINIQYASEADILNVALLGMTAAQWRERNPDEKGNVRDYATIHQLLVLANMESHNAEMINDGLSQSERLKKLNEMAKRQMRVLLEKNSPLLLEKPEKEE